MPRKPSSGGPGGSAGGGGIISGEGGSLTLVGGRGDDTFLVDDTGDSVVEKRNAGQDTVIATLSWTLEANVEALTLDEAAGDADGTGNELDNTLTGNSGNNILRGLDGDDLLEGGAGDDLLDGGAGTDTAQFDGAMQDYSFATGSDGFRVTNIATGETDLLIGIERLSFAGTIYDIGALPVATPTLLADDIATTAEDTSLTVDVLANDQGDGLTLVGVSGASFGTASVTADGLVAYTPDADMSGVETLTYSVRDASGTVTQGTLALTVTPVNDAPLPVDDTYALDASGAGSWNVLANDSDPDGDTLRVGAAGAGGQALQPLDAAGTLTFTTAAGGTVVMAADGSFSYTAAAGFSGADGFTYQVSDGNGGADVASVTLDVSGTTGSTDPVSPTVPYYVEGLLYSDASRLNAGDAIGTAVTVTYTFLTSVPDYYSWDQAKLDSFRAFSLQQQDAVRALLAGIEQTANVHFVEVDGADAATITFGLADLSGFNGIAYRPDGTATGTDASDVWLDADHAGTMFFKGTFAYLTLLHEIGHAMGLEHPTLPAGEETQQYTVMASLPNPGFASAPLFYQLYDIAALQYLYGANTDTASDDDVYGYNAFHDVLKVIWDGGGHDTLDMSASPYAVTLNLAAGAFGTVASAGGNNLAIAFGTVIEDAIGSARDDRITGNDADNVITGGAGNDLLTGGAGSDRFVFGTGWGQDRVTDFTPGEDVIDLRPAGLVQDDLTVTQTPDGIEIGFDGNTITLDGVDAVTADMFLF